MKEINDENVSKLFEQFHNEVHEKFSWSACKLMNFKHFEGRPWKGFKDCVEAWFYTLRKSNFEHTQ